MLLLGPVVGHDDDDPLALFVLAEPHDTGRLGQSGRALRRAGLEQLDHTRETVGDVLTRDTTGVERTHGQLRARLTDRLRRDDADRLAHVDELAGGEHRAVAAAADPRGRLLALTVRLGHGRQRLAREHRAHADPRDARVDGEQRRARRRRTSVLRGNTMPSASVTSSARHRPSRLRLEQTAVLAVVEHVLDPDAAQRCRSRPRGR